MSDFEQNLRKYADLLVRVGNNVQPGSRMMIQSTLDDDPTIRRFVHYVAESAYKAGVNFVKVEWRDEQLRKIRLEHAPDASFDLTDEYYFKARREITEEGGNIMLLIGGDPDILAGQDPDKIARLNKIAGKYFRPISLLNDQGFGTWTIGALAVKAWADKMLPDIPENQRVSELWNLIFSTCRVDVDDPVAAWREHSANLAKRAEYLTNKQYKTLKYKSKGTDLSIGMPNNHIWIGGGEINNRDIEYMPNIPTEEVFTMPHKFRVNGTVQASKPLNWAGTLIENFSLSFRDGKIVDFKAEKGAEIFKKLLQTDEGSRYLGEVALAPSTSPIARTGRLFYETLFDENASNHIAIGAPYRTNIKGGPRMSDNEFVSEGGNDSVVHVDFMIGTLDMIVDGITANGRVEPIMRNGDWAFHI